MVWLYFHWIQTKNCPRRSPGRILLNSYLMMGLWLSQHFLFLYLSLVLSTSENLESSLLRAMLENFRIKVRAVGSWYWQIDLNNHLQKLFFSCLLKLNEDILENNVVIKRKRVYGCLHYSGQKVWIICLWGDGQRGGGVVVGVLPYISHKGMCRPNDRVFAPF